MDVLVSKNKIYMKPPSGVPLARVLLIQDLSNLTITNDFLPRNNFGKKIPNNCSAMQAVPNNIVKNIPLYSHAKTVALCRLILFRTLNLGFLHTKKY